MPDSAPLTRVREEVVPGVATSSSDDTVIGQAHFAGTVTKVEYVPTAAMTGAVTNNRTVSLINKGQDGASTTVVATLIFAAGVTAAASNEILIPLTVNTAVVEGDTLLWRSVHNGGGIADPGGLVRITFTQ